MTRTGLIAVLCLAPVLGIADPLADKGFGGEEIAPEEWRAMAQGRTLTYSIGGAVWAFERYALSGNRVMLQLTTGECMQGVWTYDEGQYCFAWDTGEYSCFRHTRVNDKIYIQHVEDGQPTGSLQIMDAVSDAPLACSPPVTS